MIKSIKPLNFPWETQDPFLFCVHHRDEYPAGNSQMGIEPKHLAGRNIGNDFVLKDGWRMYHGQKIPGFPGHPHRGFETVTICCDGIVDHTDSFGGAGRFAKGDVQWMTAGRGIQHSEMFPLIDQDKENPLELFQVWLNLPKADKFVKPHYKMLWREDIPVVRDQGTNGKMLEIDVVAGAYNETKSLEPTPKSWAANPKNKILILTIKMEAGAIWQLPAELQNVNRSVYFYRGKSIEIEGKSIGVNQQIILDPAVDITIKNGDHDAWLLLLQGAPIGEPVVQEGPFAMNSREEIAIAYKDFRNTGFGGWPWPGNEIAHERHVNRFAKYADGSVDSPREKLGEITE